MSSALIVSNVLLWIAVVCLAAILVALLRQIGVLHERIAPTGALLGAETPRPGEAAPILEVDRWSGRPMRVGGASPDGRGTLLFFVSPTCPVCKTLLPHLDAIRSAESGGTHLLIASDGPRDEHEEFVRMHGLDGDQYVLSEALGRAYQVGRLPYAILIDADGIVRARGLVNSREHLESLFEAEKRGVASVQEFVQQNPPRASADAVRSGGQA